MSQFTDSEDPNDKRIYNEQIAALLRRIIRPKIMKILVSK